MPTRRPAAKAAKTRPAKASARKKPPWDRPNPKAAAGEPAHHLSPSQKAAARRSAKKAGRPYPNLVDNMRVAARASKKAG